VSRALSIAAWALLETGTRLVLLVLLLIALAIRIVILAALSAAGPPRARNDRTLIEDSAAEVMPAPLNRARAPS
jgi:hypothetical protein